MTVTKNWFDVDKAGLGKLMERRGKEFVLYELLANAWDEKSTVVAVHIDRDFVKRVTKLRVEDDNPEGFADLTHAFTLFAESKKGRNAALRGRFNLGEKLVIALASYAKIVSTTGGFLFDKDGRHSIRERTERGSYVEVHYKTTLDEFGDIINAAEAVIPPVGISTVIHVEAVAKELVRPDLLRTIEVTLPTQVTDDEGILRPSERQTQVEVFTADGPAKLYEMGIPVVEFDGPWHVNVMQRVPLNMERDNVTPAYARRLRVAVLNAMKDELPKEEAAKSWVSDATSSPDCEPEAMKVVLDHRFGQKRVAFDPSDQEANKRAVAAGYTVVKGGMLSAEQWKNARATATVLPAGQVTPGHHIKTSPDGQDFTIPEEKWTKAMHAVKDFTLDIGHELIGPVRVAFEMLPLSFDCGAHYDKGSRTVTFNVRRLGYAWFEAQMSDRHPGEDLLKLIIHELAHHRVADHLSDEYHEELGRLWFQVAKMAAVGILMWKGNVWR